jgi:hypothetical protein
MHVSVLIVTLSDWAKHISKYQSRANFKLDHPLELFHFPVSLKLERNACVHLDH